MLTEPPKVVTMTEEQQNHCVGLLLAIALNGRELTVESIQSKIKLFLVQLPAEVVAKAASTPMQF